MKWSSYKFKRVRFTQIDFSIGWIEYLGYFPSILSIGRSLVTYNLFHGVFASKAFDRRFVSKPSILSIDVLKQNNEKCTICETAPFYVCISQLRIPPACPLAVCRRVSKLLPSNSLRDGSRTRLQDSSRRRADL